MVKQLLNRDELVGILDAEFARQPETKGWVSVSPPIRKLPPDDDGCNWPEVILSSGRPGTKPSLEVVATVLTRARERYNLK